MEETCSKCGKAFTKALEERIEALERAIRLYLQDDCECPDCDRFREALRDGFRAK